MERSLFDRLGGKSAITSVIVEVESNRTGTPLPQSYQPAPALAKGG